MAKHCARSTGQGAIGRREIGMADARRVDLYKSFIRLYGIELDFTQLKRTADFSNG